MESQENKYLVVHPLDDIPEEKIDVTKLGPIKMTKSVYWSLLLLKVYIIGMVLLS